MRNTATCNPLNCFGQVDELTEVKSSAGLSIWRDDDGVHLKAAAYRDLAANLSNQAETNGKQPLSGQTRKRLASVIPAPVKPQPVVREPEWISGPRGGQRGGYHGAHAVGRAGQRPLRPSPLSSLER